MPTVSHEQRKQRTPRIKLHSENTQSMEPVAGKSHRRKKFLTFLTLRGIGCRGFSSPEVSVPAPVTGAKRKKKKRKNRVPENVVVDVPDVCCTPPGIGFTYDVADSTSADAPRRNRRQRSRATRRAMNLEQVSSSGIRQMQDTTFISSNNHLRRRSHGGISELFERSLDGSDRFGAWRLNVDIMSYEELVELSEKMGNVGAGLREEEILSCLKRPKQSIFRSISFRSKVKDLKCSICQEECKGEEDVGRLECGHYHHMDCIKQWLLQRNVCPVCKSAAK